MSDERYLEVKEPEATDAPVLDKQSSAEPAQVPTPDYSYGFSQEQLDSQAVRGSGAKYYAAYYQRTGATGTGNWSYTGVGFKPKMIMVKGIYASGTGAWSEGYAKDGSQGDCVYRYGTTVSYVATRVLYVTDNTGTVRQAASLVSMDADGFTLNFTTSAANADYIFVCYG